MVCFEYSLYTNLSSKNIRSLKKYDTMIKGKLVIERENLTWERDAQQPEVSLGPQELVELGSLAWDSVPESDTKLLKPEVGFLSFVRTSLSSETLFTHFE